MNLKSIIHFCFDTDENQNIRKPVSNELSSLDDTDSDELHRRIDNRIEVYNPSFVTDTDSPAESDVIDERSERRMRHTHISPIQDRHSVPSSESEYEQQYKFPLPAFRENYNRTNNPPVYHKQKTSSSKTRGQEHYQNSARDAGPSTSTLQSGYESRFQVERGSINSSDDVDDVSRVDRRPTGMNQSTRNRSTISAWSNGNLPRPSTSMPLERAEDSRGHSVIYYSDDDSSGYDGHDYTQPYVPPKQPKRSQRLHKTHTEQFQSKGRESKGRLPRGQGAANLAYEGNADDDRRRSGISARKDIHQHYYNPAFDSDPEPDY